MLTIWFGANDACIEPSPQHVPLEKFEANIRKMIDLVQSRSPETRILLITAPPVNTHRRKADLESRDPPLALDRHFETSKQYAGAVKAIGDELGLGVVDAWSALWAACGQDEAGFSQFSGDGLHLNERGYEVRVTHVRMSGGADMNAACITGVVSRTDKGDCGEVPRSPFRQPRICLSPVRRLLFTDSCGSER